MSFPTGPAAPGPSAPTTTPQPNTNGDGVVQNSVIPGVDLYGTAALAAKTAYQKALAQINEQRTGALRQYGYLGDINPETGVLTNMRVDPNNPYGLFQEMLSSHATAQQQAKAAAAARGLGHGGLAAQGITADHKSFGADSAQLGQSLMAQLEGLQGQQNDASANMNDALYQAQLDAARNAIASGAWSTPNTSGTDVPYGGDTTTTTSTSVPGPAATSPAGLRATAAALANAKAAAAKKPILPNFYTSGRKKRG